VEVVATSTSSLYLRKTFPEAISAMCPLVLDCGPERTGAHEGDEPGKSEATVSLWSRLDEV
jgi:hypothetical protein